MENARLDSFFHTHSSPDVANVSDLSHIKPNSVPWRRVITQLKLTLTGIPGGTISHTRDRRTDTHTPTTGANLDIYRSGWFGLLAILLKTKALWFHEMLKRQFKDLQQKAKLDSGELRGSFSSEIS